jgi:hypothetical protein
LLAQPGRSRYPVGRVDLDMQPIRIAAVVSAVCVLAGAPRAEPVAAAPLTIRLYDTSNAPSALVDAARAQAGGLFAGAGIETHWRACRSARRPEDSDPCDDVLGAGELVLRIVSAPPRAGQRAFSYEPLGDSLVGSGGGVLATVFADRVVDAAERAHGDPAVLLGRTIAHEIGHLLLGTPRHSGHGLMRAWWSPAEIGLARADAWRFSAGEAATMRGRLRGSAED